MGKQKEVGEFREEEALNKEENLFFFFPLTVKQPKRRRFGNKREQITWICTFKWVEQSLLKKQLKRRRKA